MVEDVLKLHSDVNFSHNASTFHEFHRFINNQEDWYVCSHNRSNSTQGIKICSRDEDYRTAHLKMMLLCVHLSFFLFIYHPHTWLQLICIVSLRRGQDITTLTNCTELMPASINLTNMTINGTVDPTLLEAAIQKYRAPWLS